ncbi:hypothetical protein [Halospeciosus flavus]|uniref:Transcriptional regulator n=1 Tax=Halospeciosus flavus TaxID=3032283 RepID=A0ABD5Z3W6_9EURY|nr:hypothetical protein [Halospeciosus flavus]
MTDDWQHEVTDPTIRVLYQAGMGLSPGAIAANLDVYEDLSPDEDAIREALDDLEAQNMARELDGHEGYYRITEHGRDYVKREFGEDVFGYID